MIFLVYFVFFVYVLSHVYQFASCINFTMKSYVLLYKSYTIGWMDGWMDG